MRIVTACNGLVLLKGTSSKLVAPMKDELRTSLSRLSDREKRLLADLIDPRRRKGFWLPLEELLNVLPYENIQKAMRAVREYSHVKLGVGYTIAVKQKYHEAGRYIFTSEGAEKFLLSRRGEVGQALRDLLVAMKNEHFEWSFENGREILHTPSTHQVTNAL